MPGEVRTGDGQPPSWKYDWKKTHTCCWEVERGPSAARFPKRQPLDCPQDAALAKGPVSGPSGGRGRGSRPVRGDTARSVNSGAARAMSARLTAAGWHKTPPAVGRGTVAKKQLDCSAWRRPAPAPLFVAPGADRGRAESPLAVDGGARMRLTQSRGSSGTSARSGRAGSWITVAVTLTHACIRFTPGR